MSPNERLSGRFDTFVFDWDATLTTVKLLRKLNERLNPQWAYRKRKSMEMIEKNPGSFRNKSIRRKIRITEAKEGVAFLADLSLYLMKPRLQNDSREVLQILKQKRKKVALFTNGAAWRVLRELAYLGIEDYFTAIVSAQDLNALKPNPLGLEVIVKALHASKERTIYIGDMANDVDTAKYCGVHSCAIANGFDSYQKLKDSRPDYLFRTMESLKNSL